MSGTGDHYVKWNKADSERQILRVISLMWILGLKISSLLSLKYYQPRTHIMVEWGTFTYVCFPTVYHVLNCFFHIMSQRSFSISTWHIYLTEQQFCTSWLKELMRIQGHSRPRSSPAVKMTPMGLWCSSCAKWFHNESCHLSGLVWSLGCALT
jgi:hypothetical protein